MPIITPAEYYALKAAGKISLAMQPSGKVKVTIDRGEIEEIGKSSILSWLASERQTLMDQVTILDTIKADVDPL